MTAQEDGGTRLEDGALLARATALQGERLICAPRSTAMKWMESPIACPGRPRDIAYDYGYNATQVNRFLDGKLPADDPAARQMAVFLKAAGLGR